MEEHIKKLLLPNPAPQELPKELIGPLVNGVYPLLMVIEGKLTETVVDAVQRAYSIGKLAGKKESNQ